MKRIKNLVLGGIAALALSGCASLPVATYTTSSGCGIAQWNQQWVQQNVESMSWTGSCESDLAQGNGTLLVKLKNGKQREYVGAMDKGFIHGDGTYTKESGWKYQGNFLWLTFTRGRIYTADGQLLFDGLMAHNEKYNGQNITFNDQRYHQGKLYFPDGSYIDDGRYTGSAGPALGIASIIPQTGRGIVYGKYMKDGQVTYRWVEGKLYQDDISYMQAQTRYYEKLIAAQNVEIAAATKAQAERSAKDRRETYALLGNAATAAAGGTNPAERRLLALNALAGNEPSAVGSNSGARGASGSSSSGVSSSSMGSVGATEMVPLSPPGNARSRNECLKLTWATSPLPIPKSWNGLDEHYRNKDMLRNPDYFGRSSNGDRAEQKHLVATSACTEDLIVVVFSCAEHTMLSAGSAPIPSSRRGDKYSWSAGAHTATGFNGIDGLNFTTSDPTSLDWFDLHIAKELVIKNQYGSSLYDARRHIVKVFYGAWLRSDITNEKSHGPRSNINLWTESFLKTLTANGKELARKREAVNKKGREVLGMDQNPESDHDKRNNPVFVGGGNGGGETRGYPAPSPDWLKLGVKTCGAFTAEEVWNATR
jgi:hypothetical protein